MSDKLRGMVLDPVPAGLTRGRFCFEGQNIVDGRRVLEFACPSDTRHSRLYWCVLDIDSLECDCRCEAHQCIYGSPAGRWTHGTERERDGFGQAQITRKASGLCRHLKKVQHWIRRRGAELGGNEFGN